jgi:exopolysaccharide production protein ExoQ
MPPVVALFLCSGLVLFLLHLDRKQAPEVSFALWLPTIWMLLIASKPLGTWLKSGVGDIETGSPLDRAFILGMLALGILILLKRRLNWSVAVKENRVVMLLLGYMLVSTVWSELPFISIKRFIRGEMVALVMAFLLLTEPDPRKAILSIFRRTIYVLIPFSYVLIHYFPAYGRAYSRWSGELTWIGVALAKNGLGRLCIFAAFFLVWTFAKRWKGKEILVVRYQNYIDAFILFLSLHMLAGPQHTFKYSATSTATLAIGLACFFSLSWVKKRGVPLGARALTAVVVFTIIYGTVTPFAGGLTLMDVSSVLGREETLTGRSEIWAELVPFAMNRPIFGYGVGGFWTTEMRELVYVGTAHNGYLDVVLNIGFAGLVPLAIFLMSSIRKAHTEMNHDFYWGALWSCCLLMVVVYNIAESSLNSFASHLTAILLFMSVCTRLTENQRKRHVRIGNP